MLGTLPVARIPAAMMLLGRQASLSSRAPLFSLFLVRQRLVARSRFGQLKLEAGTSRKGTTGAPWHPGLDAFNAALLNECLLALP